METTTCRWDDVDVHELATLTRAASATPRRVGLTAPRLENWLNGLEFDVAPVTVQARAAGDLVGWLLLFKHDGKRAEINPWALNGHPFVGAQKDFEQVASQLITHALGYAKRHGLTRIELSFRRAGEPAQPAANYKRFYESLGMRLVTETVIMRCVLAEVDVEEPSVPFEVKPLTEVDQAALYQCYYQTFNTGQDHFFFDQTEEERRVFFNQTFDRSEPFNEDTSLVATKDQQIIGFSLVRPTHGEGNCHVWMFGIHPDHRRRGLGKSLLRLVMKTAQQRFRTMSVACELTNRPALNLYRSHGFKDEFSKIEYSWKAGKP